jgi:tetratricopeptide (TPR) repeat protein
VIERKLGRLDSAAQFQQRAIDLQRQVGLREMLVFSLAHLGEINRGQGRWQAAQPVLDEAVTLGTDTGYKVGEAEALTARGALAMDLSRRDAALADLRAARAIYSTLDNPSGDIRSALQLSSLLGTTDPGEARQLAQHAAEVAERIDDEAKALEAQIVLLDLGAGDAAPLLPRLQTLGDHRLLALSWAVRARRENSPAHLRKALEHAESANDARLQAELSVELARMLMIRGQPDGIEPLLGRATVWKPDYAPVVAVRACLLARDNRQAEARRLLEQARTSAAGDADISWCPAWK